VWKAWHTTAPYGDKCVAFVARNVPGLGLDVPLSCRVMPGWLAVLYVSANTALSLLNFYWFWQMIGAVKKRFPDEKTKKKKVGSGDGAKIHNE
jgi:hypothetical protein